jgi:hypothetical protein
MKHLFETNNFSRVAWWRLPSVVQIHLLRRINLVRIIQATGRLSRESLAHYVK